MTTIDIPFTKGLHEEVDPKLLPQGLFTVAQNVRYQKDGRAGVRNGFRHDAANTTFSEADVLSVGKLDQRHHLILQKRLGDDTPPAWARHIGTGYPAVATPSTGPNNRQQSGSIGVPTVYPVFAGTAFTETIDVSAIDCVSVGGNLFVAACCYDNVTKAATKNTSWTNAYGVVWKLDAFSGAVVASVRAIDVSNPATNIKLVVMNGNIGIFYAATATDQVKMQVVDTNLTTVLGATTVATAAAGRAPYFDVCPGVVAGEAIIAYPSSTTQITLVHATTAGVIATYGTLGGFTGPECRPAVCRRGLFPTRDVALLVNDGATFITGTTKWATFNSSTLLFSGITTLTSSIGTYTAIGYPVVQESALDDWTGAWDSTMLGLTYMFQTTAGSAARESLSLYVASKPFTFPNSTFIGMLANTVNNVGIFNGDYYVIDNDTPGTIDPCAEALFWQGNTKPSDNASLQSDPRRNIVATSIVTGIEPGVSAAVCALPIRTASRGGWGIVRFEYGAYEEMLQVANLNGQLVVSGARILEYDGQQLMDVGLPTPVASLVLGGGTIAAGSYSVTVIFEWIDGLGRRHLSPPSLPMAFTSTGPGPSGGATVTILAPYATQRLLPIAGSNTPLELYVKTYRTLLNGTIYYKADLSLVSNISSTTVSLSNPDASISANEILYTQGARGGLSGILQNDIPPPARYCWAGSDRIILGHTDDPTQYQLSKLKFADEPINWSNTPAFIGNVDKPITGVAEMDGTYFIGTRDAIWTVIGQGPDDNGSGGSFDTPLRLPSDTGFYSAGSLVLTGMGLMFQGSPDRLYILPRGGGAPEWIGEPVRDTLALFPWITSAAYDQDSNLVYFAAVNTAGTLGRLLVYDTRIKQWSVDSVQARAIRSLAIFNGLLVIDGSIIETVGNYQDFDGSTSTSVIPTLTTGDIRAFGQNGWGRYRRVQILGEARDVSVAWSLSLEVSYDSGKTFGTPITWTRANLATAIGDAIDGAEHMFITQKTDSIRLRLSISTPSPTEGLVFNGLSLAVTPESDLRRQSNAYRAP